MDYCWPSSKNVTALAAAWFAASLAVGCGDETGVLVEVTRDPSTTPAAIDTLEFVIGLGRAEGQRFIKDDSSITDVAITGRDLQGSPYQLLLRNGGESNAQVMVAVIAYQAGEIVGFAGFEAPQGFIDGQVLMRRLTLIGDPDLVVSPLGCVTWFGPDGERGQIGSPTDRDCDGDATADDCNDDNENVGPSASELCDNDVDDNCNDEIDEQTDADQDGVTNCAGDCKDGDATVHPGATEICDGKDNDCNDVCDDGVLDSDDDHYNLCGEKILPDGSCQAGEIADCDDTDMNINSAADEICDGKDNDCDGTCDTGPGLDVDEDGLTSCGTVPGTCAPPVGELSDCADDDNTVRPGATEVCDGKDTDCDGDRLTTVPCYTSAGGECRVGARGCDDDEGGGFGLHACMAADNNAVVPAGFCSAYATCEAVPVPPIVDLFACANAAQAMANNKVVCQLFHKGPILCGERRADLPASPVGQNCSWLIVGGQQQNHYTVGLFNENVGGGAPQSSLDVCQGSFGVIDKLDFLPRADSLYLIYDDNMIMTEQAIEVQIVPQLVAACPAKGLTCSVVMP